MMPNSEDSSFVKVVKILAIFVFPFIIFGLIVVISFVPASKTNKEPQTPAEIEAQIQRLQAQKASLSTER